MAAASNADLTAGLFCFNIGRLSKCSQFCLTTAIVLGFFLIYGYFLVSYAGSFPFQKCDTFINITPFGTVFAQIAVAYLYASIAKYALNISLSFLVFILLKLAESILGYHACMSE